MTDHNHSDGPVPGTRLEDCEVERELGAGGFGVTYPARDVFFFAAGGGEGVSFYRGTGGRARDGGAAVGGRTGPAARR